MRLTQQEKSYLADVVAGTCRASFWSDEARRALIEKLVGERKQ